MKQKLTELKGEIHISTDFNIPLIIMDRITRQKVNKKRGPQQHNKQTRSHKHRTLSSTTEYTLSGAHETFSRIGYILG